MDTSSTVQPIIREAIRNIRGQYVILDCDLASLYGVTTKQLNQSVKRNGKRFPADFMFQLDRQEALSLKLTRDYGGRRYSPYAFTEHGSIMAAMILNSQKAVDMSVFIVRTFTRMRCVLLARADLSKRLAEIEKTLLSHDQAIIELYREIKPLLLPPPDLPHSPIGFGLREKLARYEARPRSRRRSHRTGSTHLNEKD